MNYLDKYGEKALLPFVEKLLEDYYNTIEEQCLQAKKQAEKVNALEADSPASQYTMLCENIISETLQYISSRKEKYIPYIFELSEKVNTQHNCAGCSGSCKLNHEIQLLELKASNDMMKSMVNRLQLASLPLYTETIYPDEYRLLRNHMALIETNLTELFFLENNYLIPKIAEAQKDINASDH